MYYVYAYLDPRKPGEYIYGDYSFTHEPFYIGKGKGNRKSVHFREALRCSIAPSAKTNKIRKLIKLGMTPIIDIVCDNLSNDEAFNIEAALILSIGRSVVGTGVLTNVYPGGEGAGDMPEATKKKISEAKTGKKLSAEARENIRQGVIGRVHSSETKRKISDSNKGKVMSVEARKKMSAAHKGKVLSPEVRSNISKGHIGIHAGSKNPRFGIVPSNSTKLKSSLSHSKFTYYLINPIGELFITHSLQLFCKDNPPLKSASFYISISKERFYKGWLGFREKADI